MRRLSHTSFVFFHSNLKKNCILERSRTKDIVRIHQVVICTRITIRIRVDDELRVNVKKLINVSKTLETIRQGGN